MATTASRKGATRNVFRSIARDLQDRIAEGAIETGHFLPTERELQDRYEVSRSTIRRALAQLVDTGWAHTVPSKGVVAGQGMRRTNARRIAFIDSGATYVLRVMYRKLAERLDDLGFELVHYSGGETTEFEHDLERALNDDCAGAIVWPYRGFPDQEILKRALSMAPVVVLHHGLRGVVHDLVTFDHFEAGRWATSRLITGGCKTVGVTGMYDMMPTTHDLFSGYMAAMFEHGLQPSARDFVFINTSGMRECDPRTLMARMLEADRPDGWLVLQDTLAPIVIEVGLRSKLDIPLNMKVATIGDDLEVSINGIGMTTVSFDWDAMLDLAIESLVAKIENPLRTPRTIVAPSRYVVRGSCGAAEDEWNARVHEITTFHGKLPIPRRRYAYRTHWSVDVADFMTQGGGQSNHETSVYAH